MNYKMKLIITLLLLSSLLITLPRAFAQREGLVLYLSFDGNTKDISGNENHGEVNGKESWVDGKYGKALEFDGATYVEIPDKENSGLDAVVGLTIEVWVKQSTHHDNGIVVKLTSAGTDWPCSYNLETWSDQLAYFGVNQGAAWATGSYPLDEWFHLAGVFDKGNVHLYVNGELAGTVSEPSDTVADGELPVYVGCVENRYFFTGVLDEVAIYRRALSEAEIQKNMNGIVMPVESIGKITTTWATIKAPR